jgi:hypothetical protein
MLKKNGVTLIELPAADTTVITRVNDDGSKSFTLIHPEIGERGYKNASGVRAAYKRVTGSVLDWDAPEATGTWYRSHVRGDSHRSEWFFYSTEEAAAERAKGAERWLGPHDIVAVELHGGPFAYLYA